MSQTFSFPPPPPPPPKPNQSNQNNLSRPYGAAGANRSRGGFTNSVHNGRGNGNRNGPQHQFRGSNRGNKGNNTNNNRNASSVNAPIPFHQEDLIHTKSQHSWSQHPQKRSYTTAFQDNHPPNPLNSRPLAPPAVPSFGSDLETLLPKRPASQLTNDDPSKKPNLLGLTPVAKGEEPESDDEGEEAKLSGVVGDANLLQFEYRGQTATLNSPAEIAAWIAERRQKWPTEAKREVANKEAEEKKKRQEAERAAKLEASKIAAKARQEERQKQRLEQEKGQLRRRMIREQIKKAQPLSPQDGNIADFKPAAQIKVDKLRKKAEKVVSQLGKAEKRAQRQCVSRKDLASKESDDANNDLELESLLAKVDGVADDQLRRIDLVAKEHIDPETASEIDNIAVDEEEETSSSGSSSDPGEDSGPEELSTKRHSPERIRQPLRKAIPDTRSLCNNFAKYGRCKFGHRCHYRHEKADRKAMTAKGSELGNRRKGLYQVMVDKEQEEEKERALQVIIQLGNAGLLDDSATVTATGED